MYSKDIVELLSKLLKENPEDRCDLNNLFSSQYLLMAIENTQMFLDYDHFSATSELNNFKTKCERLS